MSGTRCPDCGARMVRLRRHGTFVRWACMECLRERRPWADVAVDTRDLRAYYRDRLAPDRRAIR